MDPQQQDLEKAHRQLEEEILASTKRALRDLNDAEAAGNEALANLARQNEQLDKMVINMDNMRADMVYANIILAKIASPFNFVNLEKARASFETAMGQPAEWSGIMGKGNILGLGHRDYFFVIMNRSLMQFSKSSQSEIERIDFTKPKELYTLKGASITKADRKEKSFILITGQQEKLKLRCETDNDFVGWTMMLERSITGKQTVNVNQLKEQYGSAQVQEIDSNKVALFGKAPAPAKPEEKTTNGVPQSDTSKLIDQNLDEMSRMLDNLGTMAFETKQAIDIQNKKLDVVDDTMQKTTQTIKDTQVKHGKLLRD